MNKCNAFFFLQQDICCWVVFSGSMYWSEKGGIVEQLEGGVGGIAPDGVNE